jgi:hypothetical protein
MSRLTVHWPSVFAAYFILMFACAVAGLLTPMPWHHGFLVAAALLMGAFVPGVMAIYFMRGVRGSR